MSDYTLVVTVGLKAERAGHAEHISDKINDAISVSGGANVVDVFAILADDESGEFICEWESK